VSLLQQAGIQPGDIVLAADGNNWGFQSAPVSDEIDSRACQPAAAIDN